MKIIFNYRQTIEYTT